MTVSNDGQVFTTGAASTGLYAQSVGGGGGDGGFGLSVALGPTAGSTNLALAFGGNGGTGGAAGTVNVNNTGTVSTQTDNAHGIFAQSLGGGGGNGGLSVTADYQQLADDETSRAESRRLGGTGNNGSAVNVTNSGVVVTNGDNGGGDRCGIARRRRRSRRPRGRGRLGGMNLSVALGGTGGDAGNGGDVNVTNSGDISTGDATTSGGTKSYGIVAQSIGGGGGNGGMSFSAGARVRAAIRSKPRSGFRSAVAAARVVPAVTCRLPTPAISCTGGAEAHGIFAQSIGGGGGNGGFSFSGSALSNADKGGANLSWRSQSAAAAATATTAAPSP